MEAFATGAATNLSSEAAKGIFHEVKRHIRYVIIYKKNVDKFEEKLKTLIAKRTSVQQDVDVAERNGEKIKADVQDWRNRVDMIITEEEKKKVKDLQDKAKNKCFFGLCPNIKSRYQLSRKAEENASAFDDLIRQCQFNGVGFHDVPEVIVHKDFETFKSREKVFNDIVESLKDATMSMIGVYGMPGVGKTSLVKEVARQVQEVKLFDSVVIITVSQTPDIQKIQDQIAESLGLNLKERSPVVRARRLCERLMKEKKVLIVLDDIWMKLDLEEVGIPFGSQHKGCKILLTSRNQNVLCNEMDATKTFAIGDLDDKEAWEFFKKMAGDSVESAELRPTAIKVAKKCARLPLAIATVARALRNKSLFAWRDALRQLQRPSSENFTEISADVYSAIELSYNHLQSEELKQTFLLCSLLRRDTRIDDLLRYAIGLGLINGVNTLEEARDRLLTMVSNLKASCLLLDSNTNEQYFDVHDLTYIVAISIASKDNQVFALKEEDVLTDWPDGETMKKCNKICLSYPSISKLPDELNCPQLFLFLMFSKDLSLTLPANFFKEATNLKVLDLTKMHFSSLPSSICLLTSLCTLCLDHCELGDIAIIGELKNLEILSLLKSDIRILPKEIGQLVKLKLLDLSDCTKLKTISPGVLSSLSRLEELYMSGTFIQWEVERPANERSEASLAELKTLSRLSTLEVHIPDAKAAPGDLFFEELQKLERYKIFIGKEWKWFGKYKYSRTLKLRLSTSIDDLDRGIKMLLKKTEDLYLDELKGVKIAMQELTDEESLPHLKNLHIQNGLDIEYIINDKNEFLQLKSLTLQGLPQLISFCPEHEIDATSIPQHKFPLFSRKMLFPCLENLRLSSINVSRIWHNQLSNTSFCTHQKLTTLIIQDCGNLKHLLSFSMARCLLHLKYFEIVRCKCLREIIFSEDIEEETQSQAMTLFPQLNSLELRDLQHLIGFCSNSETQSIEFPSMKSLKIDNCPKLEGFIYKSTMEGNQRLSLQALFDNKVAFPSLEGMIISYLRKMKMIWQNPLPANSFPKLQHMEVEGCDELLTIFPSNMLTAFQGLQTLAVNSCVSLEEVFEVESVNMEEKETPVIITQLRQLHIWELPNLKYIWKNDPRGIFSFENLREINVWSCMSLKNVFPASVARHLQQLRHLEMFHCGVEEIVSKEEGSKSIVTFEFDQVSFLGLWDLPQLKCFYPGEHTTRWPMLKNFEARNCGKMKILGIERRRFSVPDNDTSKIGQLDSPNNPPLFLAEKVIPKLEQLSLQIDDIAMISDCEFSSSLFHEIKVLRVYSDSDKPFNFRISFLERFYNLEKLVLIRCEFKELFCIEGDTGNKEMYARTLSTIRNIELVALNNLNNYLWNQDVRVDSILPNLETLKVYECKSLISLGSSSASFQNLTTLDVWKCKGMKHLDTSLAVQGLAQLKKLMIRDCISMKEIVGNKGDEATCDIIFSRLKSLELRNLPRLKSFCSGNHAFGFPSLEEVIVSGCPELEIFCKGVLNAPLLERVEYEKDKGHWGGDLNSTVQQLYSKKIGYQGMEYLLLSEFSKSIEIWKENIQGNLDFKKLKVLQVYECNSLKYIFSVSMGLDLVQLKDIKVKNCPMMEQIIKNEGAEDTIVLPKLQSITLASCSKLTSFCLGSITLQCPSLIRIEVDDCPKMYAMASTIIPREQEDLGTVGREKTPFFSDKVWCANLISLELSSTNIQKLWPDKPHKAISSNVRNLRYLIVMGCHNLEHLLPSFLIKNFVKLIRLSLANCENMEEVIFTDGLGEEEKEDGITQTYLFPELQILELEHLPKLGRFCHGDNTEIDAPALFNEKVAFPSLNDLRIGGMGNWRKIWHDKVAMDSFCELDSLLVKECERLLNVFPFNMVERLEKLETLQIWECESLEEIIGPVDHRLNSNESHAVTATQLIEPKSTTKFVFPKIRMLSLYMLPKLKGFYSKMHTIEWPSLKELEVIKCNKVETFAGEYPKFRETQESQPVVSVQQPLFWVSEETFPNLEELVLSQNGIMKGIWHGTLPKQYFCNLRSLELISFPKTSVTIPNCFIQSLPNLKKLFVEKAALNEIFPCEGLGDKDEHAGTLAQLRELRLSELPELTHLWKKELSLGEVFYNLEILEVLGCVKLKNLVPSFVSFKHLTTLKVSKCHGLRNLVTFTMAKSMVQLTRMSITDCQMIEEIIDSTTDEVTDGIVFSQLKSLKLVSLLSLSRFCSGNYTSVFPCLEEVIMRQCPKMEFFAKGELSTPMLQGLQSTKGEYVGLWEGDLNATIQQLFIEKVFPSLEDLELSSINIQRIWNHKLLATHSYAQNLTCLTIEGCHNLNCLFSSSMMKSFGQLKELNIENCENVENVIFVEGLAKEEMMNQKLFRVLECLLLKDLPKLTRFCYGNYFEFPLLRILRIESCPTLKTFISDAEGNNSEIAASPTLFDEKVAFPCLEELRIIGVGNWRKILHNQSTNCVKIHFANY